MKSKKAKKREPKARKKTMDTQDTQGWPKSIVDEVRAIRNDSADLIVDRGEDRFDTNTIHSTECSICGELGEHACKPILHELIEECPEVAGLFWAAFKQYESLGVIND